MLSVGSVGTRFYAVDNTCPRASGSLDFDISLYSGSIAIHC